MSIDVIDDLHNAEDRIGLLESVLRELLDEPLMPRLDRVPFTAEEQSYEYAVRNARSAVDFEEYCRPSCQGGDECGDECGDEDCGCPCSHRGER